MRRLSILGLGCLLAAAPFGWGLLYHTSLETPDYTPDQALVGQDGWEALWAGDAAMVVEGKKIAASGRRAIHCWGGDLIALDPPDDWLLDGVWERPIEFDAVTKPAEVRVEADVKVTGPDTGDGSGDDLLSANLMARNGRFRSAWFFLSSNGNAYANSYSEGPGGTVVELWYQHETPIKLGEYNRLAITLNYLTHFATFEVNGKPIGQLPFGGTGEQFQSVLLEMAAWNAPSPEIFDPTIYDAYWDNISVRAKPATPKK